MIARLSRVIVRATPAPVLVRCAVFLTALAGLVVALPAELLVTRVVLLLPVVALWPALAPRGHAATWVALLTAGGWLLATSGYGEPVRLVPLVALASLLYVGHSLTALAAVLPYDVVVSPEALVRWLSRTLLVVIFSVALGVLVLGALDRGGAGVSGDVAQTAALAGAAAAVALSALLAGLLRR